MRPIVDCHAPSARLNLLCPTWVPSWWLAVHCLHAHGFVVAGRVTQDTLLVKKTVPFSLYQRGGIGVSILIPCPGCSPWEKPAWCWSRFKEPQTPVQSWIGPISLGDQHRTEPDRTRPDRSSTRSLTLTISRLFYFAEYEILTAVPNYWTCSFWGVTVRL